jgi:acyl-CoA oxidase
VQGLDNGLTWFENFEVPRRCLLSGAMGEIDAEGNFTSRIPNPRRRFLRTMSRIYPGRLCVSSAAMGAARASVYLAVRFSTNRLTNAPGRNDLPVMAYASHAGDVCHALARAFAMTALLNHAKRAFLAADGKLAADLNVLISTTKAMTTWTAAEIIGVCRERCGAQGIFSVNRMADYVSLLQGLITAEGDNKVLLSAPAPGSTIPTAAVSCSPGASRRCASGSVKSRATRPTATTSRRGTPPRATPWKWPGSTGSRWRMSSLSR